MVLVLSQKKNQSTLVRPDLKKRCFKALLHVHIACCSLLTKDCTLCTVLVHWTQYTKPTTLHNEHCTLYIYAYYLVHSLQRSDDPSCWECIAHLSQRVCTALHCTALHCNALHCTAKRCNRLYICTQVYAMLYLLWSVCVACMIDVSGQGRPKNLHRLEEVRYKQTDKEFTHSFMCNV